MDRDKTKAKTSIVGRLDGYVETGTEGVVWCVLEDGRKGYDGLFTIRDGDRLKIWDPSTGRSVFDEQIKLDLKIGHVPYHTKTNAGQQLAMGMCVHGIQSGWDPDEWARLFFRAAEETVFRAELTRKPVREKHVKMAKGSKRWTR